MTKHNAFMPIIGKIIGENHIYFLMIQFHAKIGRAQILLLIILMDAKTIQPVRNVMDGRSVSITP